MASSAFFDFLAGVCFFLATEGLSVVPFLLLPGFGLKNYDSENEISSWVSGSSKLGSPVSVLEGVLGQDDEEAQGLAC